MAEYTGTFKLPIGPQMACPMLDYLERNGYEATLVQDGNFGFNLTVDSELIPFDYSMVSGSSHTFTFKKAD